MSLVVYFFGTQCSNVLVKSVIKAVLQNYSISRRLILSVKAIELLSS